MQELDRYDKRILTLLQADGRMSNQDLADAIGLSPSPCLRRVKALEDAGLDYRLPRLGGCEKTGVQPDGANLYFHGSAHAGTLRQF